MQSTETKTIEAENSFIALAKCEWPSGIAQW